MGGVDADQEGIFSLSVLCRDLSTPPVADLCGLQFITCGDTVEGNTVGFPDFTSTGAGDAVYLVTVEGAVQLAATTCDTLTNFETQLMLFDGGKNGIYRTYSPAA